MGNWISLHEECKSSDDCDKFERELFLSNMVYDGKVAAKHLQVICYDVASSTQTTQMSAASPQDEFFYSRSANSVATAEVLMIVWCCMASMTAAAMVKLYNGGV